MRGLRDLILAIAILLVHPATVLADWRLQGNSSDALYGSDAGLDASFAFAKDAASRAAGGDVTRFSIGLRARGRLQGEVDFGTGFVKLGFVGRDGRPRPVRAADKTAFSTLLDAGPDLEGDFARAFEAAVSTLVIAPENRPLDVMIPGSAEGTGSDERGVLSLCSLMGRGVIGSYTDAADRVVKKTVTLQGCLSTAGGCLGRCGTGCRGPGAPGRAVLRYSRDCLALDLCVQAFGTSSGACSDEASAAMDDLWGVKDCAAMTGTWTGLGGSMQIVEKNVSGGSLNMPLTGTISYGTCRYALRTGSVRSRDTASFSLSAQRIAGPPADCCNGGTMQGQIVATASTCNQARVTVSSFCGGARGLLKKQ